MKKYIRGYIKWNAILILNLIFIELFNRIQKRSYVILFNLILKMNLF